MQVKMSVERETVIGSAAVMVHHADAAMELAEHEAYVLGTCTGDEF
jgi:hypothetical protein